MRDLSAITAVYEKIERGFDFDLKAAQTAGDSIRVQRLVERRRINDQAYFVLCWGQIESEINDVCCSAIKRRQQSTDWEQRRGWDMYDPKKIRRLTMERRVALVTDRNAATFGLVMKYGLRNRIAHGILYATRIDVTAVAADFYLIQSGLRS